MEAIDYRLTFQGAWELSGLGETKQFMGYSKREAARLYREEMRGFTITTWADGFGNWHARADYVTPLGNTGAAEEVIERSKNAMRKAIRREITVRNSKPVRRLRYALESSSQIAATNQLISLTMGEAG